jgi:CheY-like chemotaxis protein
MLRSSPSAASQSTRQPVISERPLVLVVDPDRSARAVLEVALSRDGFDVWSVASAAQGLDVLRRGRTPEVIVLESDLGGDDGFSFCAELKGNPRTARVPVVLLARRDDKNVAELAEVVGVDEAVQKPAFARDVASLVRFELVRHRSKVGQTLRFSERSLPPAHLLRALLTSTRSGTFSLAGGAATISFQDGVIVEASFGTRWGVDAVVRALALTSGEYTVQLGPVRGAGLQVSLRDLVALVLPRLAHWSALVMRSLPLDAVLAVDFARLAQSLPTMPDDVNRVVQLFDGRRSVRQVLFDSAFDEVLTLEVSTRLYLMGVIGPVVSAEPVSAPRQAPKLFEPRSAEAEELMRQLFDGSFEIRASDVEPAPIDEDWVVAGSPAADLQVEDPAGGWTAAALPDAHLADGLDDEVSRRLAAFNVPTVVEPKEPSAQLRPVADFAHGTPELAGGSMEGALRAVTGDEAAVVTEFKRHLDDTFDDDPTPPSAARRFSVEDRQERIVTPLLTPAVTEPPALAESTRALTVEGQVVSTVPEPAVAVAAAPAPAAVADEVEAAFFSSDAAVDPIAFEDTLPSHTPAAPKKASKSRVGLLIGLAVVAALVAVALESLIAAAPTLSQQPAAAALAPAPAPVAPQELSPPPSLAPVEVVEEAPVEPAIVDVAEPLADGVRAYQLGDYAKAIAILEQVVADDPKALQGWLVLGQAHYDAGQTAAAQAAAGKVLELDPKNAKVHLLLATIAHDANDKATMRAEVERYLELDPNGEHAAEARALLR